MMVIKLINFILRLLFASYFAEKDRKKKEYEEFIEKFPCPHCRPDGCTFYWDIPCHCNECGRNYHI